MFGIKKRKKNLKAKGAIPEQANKITVFADILRSEQLITR